MSFVQGVVQGVGLGMQIDKFQRDREREPIEQAQKDELFGLQKELHQLTIGAKKNEAQRTQLLRDAAQLQLAIDTGNFDRTTIDSSNRLLAGWLNRGSGGQKYLNDIYPTKQGDQYGAMLELAVVPPSGSGQKPYTAPFTVGRGTAADGDDKVAFFDAHKTRNALLNFRASLGDEAAREELKDMRAHKNRMEELSVPKYSEFAGGAGVLNDRSGKVTPTGLDLRRAGKPGETERLIQRIADEYGIPFTSAYELYTAPKDNPEEMIRKTYTAMAKNEAEIASMNHRYQQRSQQELFNDATEFVKKLMKLNLPSRSQRAFSKGKPDPNATPIVPVPSGPETEQPGGIMRRRDSGRVNPLNVEEALPVPQLGARPSGSVNLSALPPADRLAAYNAIKPGEAFIDDKGQTRIKQAR